MKENSFLIQRKLNRKNKIWENIFFNTSFKWIRIRKMQLKEFSFYVKINEHKK